MIHLPDKTPGYKIASALNETTKLKTYILENMSYTASYGGGFSKNEKKSEAGKGKENEGCEKVRKR